MKTKFVQNDWDKTRSYKEGNPWTLMFIYPMNGEPYLIKGGMIECKEWLVEHEKGPHVNFITLWHRGKARQMNPHIENLPGCMRAYCTTMRKEGIPDQGYNHPYGKVIVVFRGTTISGSTTRVLHKEVKQFPRCFPKEIKALVEEELLKH